jgi:hypothetical protein
MLLTGTKQPNVKQVPIQATLGLSITTTEEFLGTADFGGAGKSIAIGTSGDKKPLHHFIFLNGIFQSANNMTLSNAQFSSGQYKVLLSNFEDDVNFDNGVYTAPPSGDVVTIVTFWQ